MDKVQLCYVPDLRETLCFHFTPRSLEECFDLIRELCETYRDDLNLTEFFVETEDGKPMFNLSGCSRKYIIKDGYKNLEPMISELLHQCFPKDG